MPIKWNNFCISDMLQMILKHFKNFEGASWSSTSYAWWPEVAEVQNQGFSRLFFDFQVFKVPFSRLNFFKSPLRKNNQFWSKSKIIDFSLRFRKKCIKNVCQNPYFQVFPGQKARFSGFPHWFCSRFRSPCYVGRPLHFINFDNFDF